MEELYYNLSEEEFSKGRKALLWVFASLFFIAGSYMLFASLVLGHKGILPISLVPYGISVVVFTIAIFATIKRNDLFFLITDEKIEFRYGIVNAKKQSFKWTEITEIVVPQRQKKMMLRFRNGSSFVINLTWLKKEKGSRIKKHLYHAAREKNLQIITVITLQ